MAKLRREAVEEDVAEAERGDTADDVVEDVARGTSGGKVTENVEEALRERIHEVQVEVR